MYESITFVQGGKVWKKLRHRARNDLFWFVTKVLGMEGKFPITEQAHYPMCVFAERKTGIPEVDNARVQMLQLPRGLGKSVFITNGRCTQRLIQNRNWSIGIANESGDKAKSFLNAIKNNFESNEFLQALFPECIPNFNKTEWSANRIVIQRAKGFNDPINPSVLAVGIGSQTAGLHMNEWILDDLISEDAAENAMAGHFTEIAKVNRWVRYMQPLLKRPKRDPITFICTPWYLEDTYHYVVEELYGKDEVEEWFNWTITLPSGDTRMIPILVKGEIAVFRDPAIMSNGHALIPELYTLDELERMQREDPYFFASQYLLQPSAGEASDFKEEWLKEYNWSGTHQIVFRNFDNRTQFENVNDLTNIISVDTAISESKSAARSAITVVGTNGNEQFLLEAWTSRVGATDLAQQIIDFYLRYNPYRIVIETVAYQGALIEVLDLLCAQQQVKGNLPIYEHRTGSQSRKDIRIRGLEPYFKKGLFYYHKAQTEFYNEYCNFPNIKNRDLLDALSFQRDVWEKLANRDPNRSGGMIQEWQSRGKSQIDKIRQSFKKRGIVG